MPDVPELDATHHRQTLENPYFDQLADNIRHAGTLGLRVVEAERHYGEPGAVVVGLGNSLMTAPVMARIRDLADKGWTIFGIKEAISYLTRRGLKVRYSVNIDPSPADVERTPIVPGCTYILAASCHPDLFGKFLAAGAPVEVFLSACGAQDYRMDPGIVLPLGDGRPGASDQRAVILGQFELRTNDAHPGYVFCPVCTGIKDEDQLYREAFGLQGNIVILGNGLTVGNRAAMLALFMGFPRPVVCAGLDFGWREGSQYYASIVSAPPADTLFFEDKGRIDGTPWLTRADLLGSAAEMSKLIRQGKVEVLGDSLAASLSRCDPAFVREVVKFV